MKNTRFVTPMQAFVDSEGAGRVCPSVATKKRE